MQRFQRSNRPKAVAATATVEVVAALGSSKVGIKKGKKKRKKHEDEDECPSMVTLQVQLQDEIGSPSGGRTHDTSISNGTRKEIRRCSLMW